LIYRGWQAELPVVLDTLYPAVMTYGGVLSCMAALWADIFRINIISLFTILEKHCYTGSDALSFI
jgi:hypothetical protein